MMQNTITLAGQEYTIAQLTLGQIEDLQVAVAAQSTGDPQKDVRVGMKRGRDIIAAAIGNYGVTADSLKAMAISLAEFNAAVSTILEFSGLIRKKDTSPGEAAAEAG